MMVLANRQPPGIYSPGSGQNGDYWMEANTWPAASMVASMSASL